MPAKESSQCPLVSAVIPTRNRPALLCRAVRSALNQTYSNMEVVVVVDGPDPATVEILEAFHEPRFRIVALAENAGGSEARNIGVRAAKGEWIAFLDDDDEWLPEKISKQIALLAQVDPRTNFIACRYEVREDNYRKIMPRRFPGSQQNWSEYVFCHAGALPTSIFLVKPDLMLAVPFTKGLPAYQDTDWLLRARAANAVAPAWLDERLAIYHLEGDITHISQGPNWEFYYQWGLEHRGALLTRKAFSYSMLMCALRLRRSKGPVHNAVFLLYKAITMGKIDLSFCIRFLACSLYGGGARRKMRAVCNNAWRKTASAFGRNCI